MYNFDVDVHIDMRKEFNDMIFGTDNIMGLGRYLVLQSIVLGEGDRPVKSPFANKYTGEAILTKRYPNTTVTGYKCNEFLIQGYMIPFQPKFYATLKMSDPGVDNESKYLIYIPYSINIKTNDVIVTISLDKDGDIINPITPVEDYVVMEVPPITGDYGRTEYKMAIAKVIK